MPYPCRAYAPGCCHGKSLEIVEVTIPAGSASVGRKVKDLALPAETVLSLIVRPGQKPVIPGPDTILNAEDQIIAISPAESEEALRASLTGA